MEGHVERRSNGRWYPVLQLSPDPDTGRRRRTTLGGYDTRTEAREALRDAQEQARRGWAGPDRSTTVDGFLQEWLAGVRLELAPTTAALYRTLIEHHVVPRIGGIRLQQLRPADLTRLYAELLQEGGPGGRPLSPKSVRNVHTTLRKALADAVEERRLDWNPAEAAKPPRLDRVTDKRTWTATQVETFLQSVADDRLWPLYLLAAATGMRRGELLGLQWRDVDLDATRLQVRRTLVQYGALVVEKEPKTARSRRTIPLDPAAVAALRRRKAQQAEERLRAGGAYSDRGLVFPNELGGPLTPSTVSAAFRRRVKAAGLPVLTLHGLRHTFATLGLEAGVDTLYVSEILGHSSPAITMQVYQHTRDDRLTAAVRTVGDTIFGGHRGGEQRG